MTMLPRRFNHRIKACFGRSPSSSSPPHSLLVYVPDDILIEILIRLPGDDVLRCKRVCLHWQNLISSAWFVKLHVQNFSEESLFIRACSCNNFWRIYYYSDVSLNNTKRSSSVMDANLLGKCKTANYFRWLPNSCGGLMVVDHHSFFSIFNPLTRVLRKVPNYPPDLNLFCARPCGIYFDRFRDEYKLLSVAYLGNNIDQYFFFSLSRNVWERLHQTSSPDFRLNLFSQAAIVGDVIYWIGDCTDGMRHCSKMVVAFDIQREEFYCLPHPLINQGDNHNNLSCATTQERVQDNHDRMMRLIVKDGQLCFCHTLVQDRIINLWILEDNTNWDSWVIKYNVNLLSIHYNLQLHGYIYSTRDVDYHLGSVNIICSQVSTNEIIFTLKSGTSYEPRDRGLWLYNLETHRTKRIRTSVQGWGWAIAFGYIAIPYNKTILSPYISES